MLRTVGIFVGLVVLLGAGMAVAAGPRAAAPAGQFSGDDSLVSAYGRVSRGMPVSDLTAAGLDIANAKRLSAPALMKAFLPADSNAFDTLEPGLQACFRDREGCDGYLFGSLGAEALVIVQNGRVSWKMMLGLPVT